MKIIPQSINLMHGGDNDRAKGIYLHGVNLELTYLNIYWKHGHLKCYTQEQKLSRNRQSFLQADHQYYLSKFSLYAASLNMKVDEYLNAPNSSPIEFIFKYDPTVSTETIVALFSNLANLLSACPDCLHGFTRLKVLSWALHADEPSVGPHVHLRVVWANRKLMKTGVSLEYVPFGLSIATHNYSTEHIPSYEVCFSSIQSCIELLLTSLSRGTRECKFSNDTVHRVEPLEQFLTKKLIGTLSDIDSLNIVPEGSDILDTDKIGISKFVLQDQISTKIARVHELEEVLSQEKVSLVCLLRGGIIGKLSRFEDILPEEIELYNTLNKNIRSDK